MVWSEAGGTGCHVGEVTNINGRGLHAFWAKNSSPQHFQLLIVLLIMPL